MSVTFETRFRAKFEVRPNGCWEWTASLSKGYGQFRAGGTHRGAHRVAYELWVGPIPDGLHIDHLCSNPICVNPDHLEPVTCEVNLLRGATTLTRINREKTHCPQGHPYAGDNLRFTPNGGRYCLSCKRIKKAEYDARQRGA